MNTRRLLQLGPVALALAAVFAAARPAVAEVLDREETAVCLCKEQQIDQLRAEVDVRAAARADAEAKLAQYDKQLAERYGLVDTGSELSVEQYKYIWEQRWALQERLQQDIRPAHLGVTTRLNAIVADYNATCANRSMIQPLVDQVLPTLQCPAP